VGHRMLSEADLDDEIRRAFGDGVSSDAIVALIAAVERAARAANQQAEVARESALDPARSRDGVREARRQADDAEFERDRLQAALEKLRARLVVVKADEQNAQRLRTYEAAETERDQLAQQLRECYPAASEKLAELLAAISANDATIERVNNALPRERGRLLSAELVARDLPGWVQNAQPTTTRLTQEVRLPAFHLRAGPGGNLQWPKTR
jgi:hypothetical protein